MTEEEAFDRISPFNYLKCKSCAFRTKSLGVIISHVKKHQVDSKSNRFSCLSANLEAFECEFCYFKIDLKIALDRHESMVHRGHCSNPKIEVNSYLCDKCDFKSYSLLVFARHVCDYSRLKSENNSNQFEVLSPKLESNPDRRKPDFEEYWDQDGVRWLKCEQCSHKAKRNAHLKIHILAKHTNLHEVNWFKCDKCDHQTKFKINLKKHILSKHNMNPLEVKWFECDKCDYKSKFKRNLKKHIFVRHACDYSRLESENNSNQFEVRSDRRKRDFKEYCQYWDQDGVRWFKCGQCSHKTKRKQYLKKHILSKHTNSLEVKWFECDKCDYKSKFKRNLKKHIWSRHTDPHEVKWFECDRCDHKTKLKYLLNQHILSKHTEMEEARRFECEKCPYKAKFLHRLKKHILAKHTNEAECFKCEQCSFKGRHQSDLKRHNYAMHPNSEECHKCEHCSFKTRVKDNFEKHMLIHTDPEQVTWLKCEQCSYKSIFKKYLTRHISNIHSNEEKCKQCSYKTGSKRDMKRHIVSVHLKDVKLFKCEQCSYVSRGSFHLKRHIKLKHIAKNY